MYRFAILIFALEKKCCRLKDQGSMLPRTAEPREVLSQSLQALLQDVSPRMDKGHGVLMTVRLVKSRTGLPEGFSSPKCLYHVSGWLGTLDATTGDSHPGKTHST